MGYFYDRTFKKGLMYGVIVYLLFNAVSYYFALKEYEEAIKSTIQFAPGPQVRWGFPLVWGRQYFLDSEDGIINIFVAAIFGIAGGLALKYVDRWRA
ncbi:MAG: hypothetical protein KBF83_09835 [Pyrinomonadaceae bacterium]|nr:hypothetical protein [Pyrinomonadaceae bacterium]